jgi:hypothetical protein
MPVSSDQFSLEYDAAHQFLIGNWSSGISDNDLYSAYERLLTAAKAPPRLPNGLATYWLNG